MFWNAKFPTFSNQFSHSDTFDVVIVGGGITGLSTAYYLKDSNLKVAVIEKDTVGRGVTAKSTAKISYLQGDIYQKLDEDQSYQYYLSQKDAIDSIVSIIKKEKISCDLEKVDSIIFTLDEDSIYKIEREKEILEKYGCSVFDVTSSKIKKGIGVHDTYVFHPVKYLAGLSRVLKDKISFYEHTLVSDIKKESDYYVLKTNSGVMRAHHVVLACFYPFFLYPFFTPLKSYLKREYVNVCKMDKGYPYSAISIDSTLHSIRYYKDYLLYNSNGHRLTSKIDYGKNYQQSQEDLVTYFGKKPTYTWANQDMISLDNLPFIGEVKSQLYIGCCYGGWGITNGTIAGRIISNAILKKKPLYHNLFRPQRMSFSLFASSFLGTFHYMKVYLQTLWKKNLPSYIRINGVSYAIYKDKEGEVHRVCLVCPHMKCHLVYNSYDETWDCPCHGSRFKLDGTLLLGPAKEDLKK